MGLLNALFHGITKGKLDRIEERLEKIERQASGGQAPPVTAQATRSADRNPLDITNLTKALHHTMEQRDAAARRGDMAEVRRLAGRCEDIGTQIDRENKKYN